MTGLFFISLTLCNAEWWFQNHLDCIRLSGYTEFMDETIQVLKALSEEIRLRVLSLLMAGELCVCDLMAVLDLPQSTVSRHLACLRNAGWVTGRRHGLWMYYRISENMTPLHAELMSILRKHLAELDQIQTDGQRYLDYLKNKKADRCD